VPTRKPLFPVSWLTYTPLFRSTPEPSVSHPFVLLLALVLTVVDATLAPLSASSSLIEKTAATAKVGTQLNLITTAVTSTTNDIKALPKSNETTPPSDVDIDFDPENTDVESQPQEKRQLIAVGALLALIIVEIFATVTAAVAILGLAGLLIFLSPLTSALSLLIVAVQLILNVVLFGVIALLNSLLAALALGLSGL
jgi:hypothetical protein